MFIIIIINIITIIIIIIIIMFTCFNNPQRSIPVVKVTFRKLT